MCNNIDEAGNFMIQYVCAIYGILLYKMTGLRYILNRKKLYIEVTNIDI